MVGEVIHMNVPNEYDTAMKELCAKALSDCIMNYMKPVTSEDLLRCIQSNAVTALAQIKTILDDESLDDPACFRRIDAIVDAFHKSGISTIRHDF